MVRWVLATLAIAALAAAVWRWRKWRSQNALSAPAADWDLVDETALAEADEGESVEEDEDADEKI